MEKNDVVIIELDRPRELRLTHKVLKRFCAQKHLRLTEIDSAVEDYGTMTDLVYMMLQEKDPELTPEFCDELLDQLPIMEVVKKASEAIAAGLGANQENAAEGGNEENPTGKNV